MLLIGFFRQNWEDTSFIILGIEPLLFYHCEV